MTEVKTMGTEKETGIIIQNHERLAAITIATKPRDQTQELTDRLSVRADLIDRGILIDVTHILHTSRKMVHCTLTPLRLVFQM